MSSCFVTLVLLTESNKFCMFASAVKLCSQVNIPGILPVAGVILSTKITDGKFL